jgi:hypothetical protein
MMAAVPPGRVFVIQNNPDLDYDDAQRYGSLVPVIRRDVFPDDWPLRVLAMRDIIVRRLKDFDSALDSVLLTGDPVAIFLVGTALAHHDKVRVLKYDRKEGRYYDVMVQLDTFNR